MTMRTGGYLTVTVLATVIGATSAEAHWCDDLWASAYNITVRPDSDTSPSEVFVQNNMGYHLVNFKLTAKTASGNLALTAPTTLKVANTLLPAERAVWKITGGSPAKVEDITFSVSFGNSGQSARYPLAGAKAVVVVKQDGSLYPAAPLPGLASPSGDVSQARSLVYQAVADFEDVGTGLDKLLQLYCSGRASWNSGSDAVSPTYCKDTASTLCPSSKPSSGSGSKYDYMHLWAAGELAVRKASLGARAAVFRERLACAVNDGDMGFAGYAAFVLGYLGDDASARTTLERLVSAGGELGTVAKAALYMMGDATRKADVEAGAKTTPFFGQMACAAALGIVDGDDAAVTSTLLPAVKWTEPDTSDNGKGMYAAHLLELVAFQRRGWVPRGVGAGAVSFYGETGAGAGGGPGSGGASGGTGGASGGGAGGGPVRGGAGGGAGGDTVPGGGGGGSSGCNLGQGKSTGPLLLLTLAGLLVTLGRRRR